MNTRSSNTPRDTYIRCYGLLPQYIEPLIVNGPNGAKNNTYNQFLKPEGYIDGNHLNSSETFDMLHDDNSISDTQKVI